MPMKASAGFIIGIVTRNTSDSLEVTSPRLDGNILIGRGIGSKRVIRSVIDSSRVVIQEQESLLKLNQIIEGDALTVLKTMPSKLVQCVVTSPPYWGLRDYGEPGQLGLEATPEEYVAKMVEIFAEVRRVLRDDGTLWLNMGDSYAGSHGTTTINDDVWASNQRTYRQGSNRFPPNLKPKDLCGIPWCVAFALQADGWYLRSDIIWSKPNPMPESVTDRPTKAHEYMFLMTKKARYYYDADAIREPHKPESIERMNYGWDGERERGYPGQSQTHNMTQACHSSGRNRRTVWEIATQPYPLAHFATFPEKLVEPCILASSSDRACGICGAAWERVTEKEYGEDDSSTKHIAGGDKTVGQGWEGTQRRANVKTHTLGFRPTCSCSQNENEDSQNENIRRSIILDPFMGSGTVALVALKHGRDYIGIELKPDYIAMAMKRLKPLGNRPLAQQEILI